MSAWRGGIVTRGRLLREVHEGATFNQRRFRGALRRWSSARVRPQPVIRRCDQNRRQSCMDNAATVCAPNSLLLRNSGLIDSHRLPMGTKFMKRIYFFATKLDILTVANAVEERTPLQYILAYHRLHPAYGPTAPTYPSASRFPHLGIATAKQTGSCERYIVASRTISVVPMTRLIGGQPESCFEMGNCPDCVELNAGGLWEGQVLINGLVQTWSDSKEAQRLMRLVMSTFKKAFKQKIGAYWIGPEALEFLRGGGRLTLNVDADPSFDIQIGAS